MRKNLYGYLISDQRKTSEQANIESIYNLLWLHYDCFAFWVLSDNIDVIMGYHYNIPLLRLWQCHNSLFMDNYSNYMVL